jgi:hypothetical protein
MVRLICKKTNIDTLCEPSLKKNSLILKWFCFNCNRYVQPDGKYHFTLIEPLHKTNGGKYGKRN